LSATPEGLRVSTGLRLSTQSSFWVITALLLALFGSAGAPAPLYQVYQAKLGFSTTILTLVFAVYVLTLLATLLTVGSLSDHVGRRPVMVAAIATAAVASGLFLTADGVTALILARATQGVAIGLTSGSLVAAMLDLRPQGESAPLMSSVAPTAGLAIGALVTSGLVEYGPHPTRLIWSLLLAVFVIGVALVLAIPEPGRRRPGAIASLRPRLGVPASARSAFAVAAPCVIGLWALGGFYLSLGPSLARELVHSSNLMWGGLSICLLTGFGAIGSAATRHRLPRVTMIAGCGGLLVGVAITVAAIATGAAWLLFAGTAVAGTGFGTAFSGAYRTVVAASAEDERAALITATYTMSYAAFGVPALLAGIAASHYGLRDTAMVYAAAVAALAGGALLALIAGARRDSGRRTPAVEAVALPPGPCTCPPCAPDSPALIARVTAA
jgi:MFS family permease